jgi:hypothetical protein
MPNKLKDIVWLVLGIIGLLMFCIGYTYAGGGSESTVWIMIIIGLLGFYISYKFLRAKCSC